MTRVKLGTAIAYLLCRIHDEYQRLAGSSCHDSHVHWNVDRVSGAERHNTDKSYFHADTEFHSHAPVSQESYCILDPRAPRMYMYTTYPRSGQSCTCIGDRAQGQQGKQSCRCSSKGSTWEPQIWEHLVSNSMDTDYWSLSMHIPVLCRQELIIICHLCKTPPRGPCATGDIQPGLTDE